MTSFDMKFLVLMMLLPLFSLAQNNGRIAVNSSLTAGEEAGKWVSGNGDFGFGFKQLQDEDHFLLSIWYDKIPEKTVVWYANGGQTVRNGSRVEVNAKSGLVLRDPTGQLIWNTTIDRNQNDDDDVGYGFLNDTGNFVLVANSNDTYRLWESFKHPTDTLLPSQEIEIGGMLISRRSETNLEFSQGRFYLRMLEDGNVVLSTKSSPATKNFDGDYYNSLTSDAANASGSKLVFSNSGSLYVLKKNGETKQIGSTTEVVSTSNYYHRVTLTFDGVLRQYYCPRSSSSGNQSWSSIWFKPDDICSSFIGDGRNSGACGFNSICTLGTAGRPTCNCPKRYWPDPNNEYGSCKTNLSLTCDGASEGSPEDVYDFDLLVGHNWPFNDYELLEPLSEADCKNSCLHDCFCAVAIFNRASQCWKKRLPLSNGIIEVTGNFKALLKYKKSDGYSPDVPQHPAAPQGPKTNNDSRNLVVVVSALLGSSVLINIVLIGAGCLEFFLIYRKKVFSANNSVETNLRCFTFKELEEATNGFKEELGRGAFGIVYKGAITGGSRSAIAVKKLDRAAQDTEKEFRTEVKAIGRTDHKNLVHLIGFCDEGLNRLLVYEYMSNGTLASFLFGDLRPSWSQRTKIAQGVARGLVYLHEECSTQIIHCDIKPQNILLDNYYNARISDFGLAKLLVLDQSRTNTGIRGTKGYVAPEWFRHVPISAKVDVYSFGVLLLEIISCRKSIENLEKLDEDSAILTDWTWDCFQEGRLDDLVGDDKEAMIDREKLERLVKIGIWCIQEDSSIRPTMRKVSQMLEGVVEVSNPPCPLLYSTAI